MNIFRLTADLAHLVAIFILALKMWTTRSVAGISGRSQLLFAAVFTSRYLDLFTNFISVYNSAMKVFLTVFVKVDNFNHHSFHFTRKYLTKLSDSLNFSSQFFFFVIQIDTLHPYLFQNIYESFISYFNWYYTLLSDKTYSFSLVVYHHDEYAVVFCCRFSS